MPKTYKVEDLVRTLAIAYEKNHKESDLIKFYHASTDLVNIFYHKYINEFVKQKDFKEDIIHDVATVCAMRLKKGTVRGDTAWSKYVILVLKNRVKATNPQHSSYSIWKRLRATTIIKTKLIKGVPIPIDMYDIDMCSLDSSPENITELDKVESISSIKKELKFKLKKYIDDCCFQMPFRDKSTQNLFLYFSVLTLFDISIEDKKFFRERKGWLPRRYIFLIGQFRNKFKRLVGYIC